MWGGMIFVDCTLVFTVKYALYLWVGHQCWLNVVILRRGIEGGNSPLTQCCTPVSAFYLVIMS